MDGENDGKDLIEIGSLDDIPAFDTEADEAAFWSRHELSAELWRRYGRRVGDSLIIKSPAKQKAKGVDSEAPNA